MTFAFSSFNPSRIAPSSLLVADLNGSKRTRNCRRPLNGRSTLTNCRTALENGCRVLTSRRQHRTWLPRFLPM